MVAPAGISPNADGQTDVAVVAFTLSETSYVSFFLTDSQGRQFTYRTDTRLAGTREPYSVYFAGVVDAFSLPDDVDGVGGTVVRRVVPDGEYTWTLHAESVTGREHTSRGPLTVTDAEDRLPAILGLQASPETFSPNQDGIEDDVAISLTLDRDVQDLRVHIRGADGMDRPVEEDERLATPTEAGEHVFVWDGGIAEGLDPPPDGVTTVVAEAQDEVGQLVVAGASIQIVDAGQPSAYVVAGDVDYSATTLVLSDTLCFTLTVENDGEAPIRTTGPWPGATYADQQNFNTLGWPEDSGVFRIAMDYDAGSHAYPFRWGIGTPGVDLVRRGDAWYLEPGARSCVHGCVQITEIPERNPLHFWMGLLHEDVEMSLVNHRVDPAFVTIWEP